MPQLNRHREFSNLHLFLEKLKAEIKLYNYHSEHGTCILLPPALPSFMVTIGNKTTQNNNLT